MNIPNAMDLVNLLLHYGANVNQSHNNETALTIAAANDAPTNVVEQLLKGGADVDHVDSDGNTALLYACMKGREKVVKTLLDHGAKADYINRRKCETALTVAVKGQAPVALVEGLLKRGASVKNIDKNGDTTLLVACRKSAETVVDHVNHVTSNGKTTLISVCQDRNKEMLRLLLEYGADMNVVSTQTGESPLTAAVSAKAPLTFIENY